MCALLFLIPVLASGCALLGDTGRPVERPSEAPDDEGRRGTGEARKNVPKQRPLPEPEDSCDALRVLVDGDRPLPRYYVPRGLVRLGRYGVPSLERNERLRREAAGHLRRLVNAAEADGEELVVASAYRSYAEQRRTFAPYVAKYGKRASNVSAPPGQSQHQLGTAVDFTNADADYGLVPSSFGKTSASRWLVDHAPEYGFVLAYPRGDTYETGVQWEPWHYRYVGVENAKRLQRSGTGLQAFLVREGVRPRC